MTLYNIRPTPTGAFTIAKFDDDCNFETSYIISADLKSCSCPAGPRPSCKHRKMVPRMVDHLGDGWFYDYDRQKWHKPIDEADMAEPASDFVKWDTPETGSDTETDLTADAPLPELADAVGSEHHSSLQATAALADKILGDYTPLAGEGPEPSTLAAEQPTSPSQDVPATAVKHPDGRGQPAPAVQGIRRRA